jgi:hypothetical protein
MLLKGVIPQEMAVDDVDPYVPRKACVFSFMPK